MKMKFVKAISILTMLATLLGLLAGCNTGVKKVDAEDKKSEQNNTVNVEPVELKVAVFDRGIENYLADDNFQTRWIQENFGDPNNIKITFVPIPRWQEIEHIKMLMGLNQAPDICITYSAESMANFAINGSLYQLDGLLDEYAPNLKEYLGEDLLSYGRWDNKQYALPAQRVLQAAIATFIRKDWLDKLNLPIPKTSEEFFQTMKAFKEKDPGNLGKDNTIPFTFHIDQNSITWSVHTILNGSVEEVSDEDRNVLPSWFWPGYKEGARYLNRLYNEGLTCKDFSIGINGGKATDYVTSGQAGAFITSFDIPYRTSGGSLNELRKNVPDAELIPIDPFSNSKGEHPKMIYNPNGLYIFIPKSSERVVEALKYLEWMSNPEVMFFLQNGEKGIHYTEEKNGIPTKVVPMDQVPQDKIANYQDLAIIVNGKVLSDRLFVSNLDKINCRENKKKKAGTYDLHKLKFRIA